MQTATVSTNNPPTYGPGGPHGWRERTGRSEGVRSYPEAISMDSKREFEKIKEKGLYRAPGTETPDETEVDRPVHIIKEKGPVVEDFVSSKQVHEIVPEVYREHEVSEIRHALLPIHERVNEGPTRSETRLEGIRSTEIFNEMSPEEIEKNNRINAEFGRVHSEELPTEHIYYYHPLHVHKVVKPKIIHEVHPVITREINKEHVQREILPVYERIVDGARISDEIDVLKSISFEEWERKKRPGEGGVEYLYRSPPRSATESKKGYSTPEGVRDTGSRITSRSPSETERIRYGHGYKVLDPGYTAHSHPVENPVASPGAASYPEGISHRASHIVHPIGHEDENLHRMSPIRPYKVTGTAPASYLQTPTASPR